MNTIPETPLPLPPFLSWSGPRDARMVIVGEAWGQSEEQLRRPFAGESGKELWLMLGEAWPDVWPEEHQRVTDLHRYGLAWVRQREAWLQRASIGLTNVLSLRPPDNRVEELCIPRSAASTRSLALGPIRPAKFLQDQFLPEISRLEKELSTGKPNLIVAMGNTACWAILHASNIGQIRGTATMSPHGKTLPTYHPAAVLRQWSWRPIVVADLMKARRESTSPQLQRPERWVVIDPELSQIAEWVEETLRLQPPLLACDIETGAGQIKCVGFARSRSQAMIVPFVDLKKPEGSYWGSQADESSAWHLVQRLLGSGLPLVFQNGLYDLQYLLRTGLRPANLAHDSMLLHHSLFPEMQKGLGFLGSVYTNEASWKLMRRVRPDSEKRDE